MHHLWHFLWCVNLFPYPALSLPALCFILQPQHVFCLTLPPPRPAQVVNPDSFVPTLNDLLEERDPGLLLSSVTLLSGILARNGPGGRGAGGGYEGDGRAKCESLSVSLIMGNAYEQHMYNVIRQ